MKLNHLAAISVLLLLSALAVPQTCLAETYVFDQTTSEVATPGGTGVTNYSWSEELLPMGTTIIDKPRLIERTIEAPAVIENTVEGSAVVEKSVTLDSPVFIDRTVEKPVYIDRVIEKPVVVEKPVVIEKEVPAPIIIKGERHHLLHVGVPGVAGFSLF